jgi:hypothetical protein
VRILAKLHEANTVARHQTAPWERIGLNRMGRFFIAVDAGLLIVGAFLYTTLGLSIRWSPAATLGVGALAFLLALWANYRFSGGSATEYWIAEVLFVIVLLIVFVNLIVLGQYAAVALAFPYADPWLAAADARLGIYVPALVQWTTRHPVAGAVMATAYFTHVPQFGLAAFGLGALRERETLWEFAFHFHVCLLIALVAFAAWPAACVPAYFGFAPTINVTRAIDQIRGFHQGTMNAVRFDDVDGLVSFPSFHVAGGLIVTWAFRRHPRFLVPLVVVNIGMVAATVMTGLHYVVDVIASLPLVAISLLAYRWWGRELLNEQPRGARHGVSAV